MNTSHYHKTSQQLRNHVRYIWVELRLRLWRAVPADKKAGVNCSIIELLPLVRFFGFSTRSNFLSEGNFSKEPNITVKFIVLLGQFIGGFSISESAGASSPSPRSQYRPLDYTW